MMTTTQSRPALKEYEVHVERTMHVIMTGTVRIRAVSAERAIELLEGSDDNPVDCGTIMALVDKNGGAIEETGDCEECWHPTGEVEGAF